MTKHSHTLAIPLIYLNKEEMPRFLLWLGSMNLPPEAAYRVYKEWCEKTGTSMTRRILDDVAGPDFNVN